jgi:hypothetical protein
MILKQIQHKIQGERGHWMTVNVLTGAVREGARLASVTPDLPGNREQIENVVTELLNTASLEAKYVVVMPEPADPNMVRVEAAVDYFFIPAPFFQMIFGEGYTFVRSASCYYEGHI